MQINEVSTHIEEVLTYPIDRSAVIKQIGTVEIEAPDREDTETVATILDSLGPETYDSADELYNTIIGNVSDEHIGRKYYDDRGQQNSATSEGRQEERDVSF